MRGVCGLDRGDAVRLGHPEEAESIVVTPFDCEDSARGLRKLGPVEAIRGFLRAVEERIDPPLHAFARQAERDDSPRRTT